MCRWTLQLGVIVVGCGREPMLQDVTLGGLTRGCNEARAVSPCEIEVDPREECLVTCDLPSPCEEVLCDRGHWLDSPDSGGLECYEFSTGPPVETVTALDCALEHLAAASVPGGFHLVVRSVFGGDVGTIQRVTDLWRMDEHRVVVARHWDDPDEDLQFRGLGVYTIDPAAARECIAVRDDLARLDCLLGLLGDLGCASADGLSCPG